jgi:glucose-1-phosphatase
MTRLFIFDMDDVLYDYDWRARMATMTAITGLDLHELRRRWWHDDGEWAAEAGGFATGAEYLSSFTAAIGVEVTEEDWVDARAGAMSPRPKSLAAVRRAAELGDVTLLTNNGVLAHEHLARLAPDLVPLFGEHMLTSSFYGARKPNPVVYERVLARYARDASEAFFADDMRVNVEGAASIGITAHLYSTPQAMLAAIEEFAAKRHTD